MIRSTLCKFVLFVQTFEVGLGYVRKPKKKLILLRSTSVKQIIVDITAEYSLFDFLSTVTVILWLRNDIEFS